MTQALCPSEGKLSSHTTTLNAQPRLNNSEPLRSELRKRDTALVSYKTCPRCAGAGQVPCNGREYYHQLAREWANSLHGRMVMIPFYKGHNEWTRVPGLAICDKFPGGWHGVKVYISIDNAPNWGNFNTQRYGYDENHDVINGHKLYYISKGRPARKDVIPIDVNTVRHELKEITQLIQCNSGEEQRRRK